MYLGPGEEYTVKKVVSLALQQDIGPDNSQASDVEKDSTFKRIESATELDEARHQGQFNPENYFH